MVMRKRPKLKFRQNNDENENQQFETERIRVKQLIGENTEQTVIRDTVKLPYGYPDIEEILSIDTKVKLKKAEIIPNKVIVEGKLRFKVLYTAFEKDQSVHAFDEEIEFTDFIEVEGARPGMDAEIEFVVEDFSLKLSRSCEYDLTAVLQITAKITEDREVDAIIECPMGYNCETERMSLEQVVGSNTKQILIDDEFELPDERDFLVSDVLKCMCDVEITKVRVIKNKILFDGEVDMECLYAVERRADKGKHGHGEWHADKKGHGFEDPKEDKFGVHSFERTFKFSNFIEVEGAEQGMEAYVDAMVESCSLDITDVSDCKFSPLIVLKIKARVVEDREVDVVTDIEGADVDTVTLDMESLVAEECKQVIIRDAKETPAGKPDVDKVREITVGDVVIKDVDVIQDKVLIKGTVEFEILYIAMNERKSLHTIHRKVDFKTFIDVPGARPENEADIDVEVEWANVKLEKDCELLIEAVLKVCARVTETVEQDVVIGFTPRPTVPPTTLPPTTTCVPGTTFNYTIAKGDTLSKLAQRYGTTVQAIQAANPEITNPNMLNVGDVIKIPCVAKG
ncbi:Peptidoglycan-binding LysM [Desulforamulus reducens MI-1]|uniref:Peptidoglycan-binding LysM n=1 Tax=Desulforamulus reducens (strain ATCC BAA-1160 / DSM 100696 / MI-1) TaxID=349161 RepID=A4J0M9_DESRM|nr:SPOCS domain-containing protein [Desulforamulus reducens]ABO48632.1 Peptidoglycan-binding LysM [Desulforamulus reducens MI-1]